MVQFGNCKVLYLLQALRVSVFLYVSDLLQI